MNGPDADGRRRSTFRFYAELNDFLAPALRQRPFVHAFEGTPAVKDRIEALGVPHTEVDLIVVDGQSAGFGRRLTGGERVAVYPVFEAFDIAGATRLRPEPLRETRFVLDVHLGRLAAWLRLLGFDSLYRNDFDDPTIIDRSLTEHRIILTRDTGLLKDRRVTHGAFVHATEPLRQLREIVDRFQLERRTRPWTRCMECNGPLEAITPARAEPGAVPDDVLRRFGLLARCRDCRRHYWPGSHYDRMRRKLESVGLSSRAAAAGRGAGREPPDAGQPAGRKPR